MTNRKDAEAQRADEVTNIVIGAAIEVHRWLGPGLLESAYEQCLCHELKLRNLEFECQRKLPLAYKGIELEFGYRMDMVVENAVLLELKTVEKLLPIHDAQLLTYLKLSGIHIGLLLNFHEALMKHGIKRIVNNH
jgi:GxxExxY protein